MKSSKKFPTSKLSKHCPKAKKMAIFDKKKTRFLIKMLVKSKLMVLGS